MGFAVRVAHGFQKRKPEVYCYSTIQTTAKEFPSIKTGVSHSLTLPSGNARLPESDSLVNINYANVACPPVESIQVPFTTKPSQWIRWLIVGSFVSALAHTNVRSACADDQTATKDSPPSPSEFQVDVFTPRHGMPGLSVTALAQAADGHIWIGLTGQLARFDGQTFQTVQTPTRISPRSEVRTIVAEGEDVWIGTMREGVMKLGVNTKVWSESEGLPNANIAQICRDASGTIWAGTTSGPARLVDGRFEPFAKFDVRQWHRQGVNDLLCSSEGVLVAPHAGPPWWIPQTAEASARSMPSDVNADTLVKTSDGTIWLGGIDAGLVGVSEKGQVVAAPKGLPKTRISNMLQDSAGTLWVGTWGSGLFQKRRESETFARVLEAELPSGRITALLSEQGGSLWVGTDAGLVHIRPRLFTHIVLPKEFEGSPPRSILVSRDGSLWAASDGAGVSWHPALAPGGFPQSEKWRVFSKQHGLPSSRVFSIVQTNDGGIFVGTNLGAAKFNGHDFDPLPQAHELALNEVRTMYADPDGSLWMGIAGQGVVHRSVAGVQTFFGAKAGLRASYVESFATDSKGQLWLGSEDGLFRFVKDHFEQHAPHAWPLGVSAIANAPDGALWISGGDSLRRLETAPPYKKAPVAIDSNDENFGFISGILATEPLLWVLSRHGLYQAIANGSSTHGFQRFGMEDGLRDADFSHPANPRSAVLPDGRVLFNSATEIVATKLEARTAPRLFAPVITALTVNGQMQSTSRPLALPAGRSRLDFSFTAVTFSNASALQFRASVTSEDQVGTAALGLLQKARSASYQNLPSGRYTFAVSVVPPGFTQSPYPAATFKFTIASSWHEMWWIRLILGFMFIATFIIVGSTIRARKLASRFALLTAERNRIAIDLHDGIEQNMAGILLQLGVAEHRLPQEHPALAPVAAVRTIVGQVHSDLRHQVWQLRGRGGHADLKSALVAQLQRSETAGIESTLVFPSDLHVAIHIEEILLRTVEEAVTNCLKHANAKHLAVHVSKLDAQLALHISDDGIGFHVGDLNNTTISHLGVIGMRERVENAHGRLTLETSPGAGTRITVTLPS